MSDWTETHGTSFELVRHFVKSLFDSQPGQFRKGAIGVVSTLAPIALLGYPTFAHRYGCVASGEPRMDCPAIANYVAQYASLAHTDAAWLIALAICLTAAATALQWESLFPSRRDLLALASFPVSARQIFGAKFAALLAALAIFSVTLTGAPAILFTVVTDGPFAPGSLTVRMAGNFAALATACGFTFFALVTLQGALLLLLPRRMWTRVSILAQAAVFTFSVGALPFAWREPPASAWWPVNWFLAVREGNVRTGLAAIAAGASASVLLYLAGYWRYTRLLLESPHGKRSERTSSRLGSRILEMLVRDPREQAVLGFWWKTLLRSRTHQLVLEGAAGLAGAWILQEVEGSAGRGTEVVAIAGPLAAAAFLIVGLRYLFSLPSELAANWLFQITETAGREAWQRATGRFVTGFVLAPVYFCAFPVAVASFGWWQAIRLSILSFVLALVLFEFWFRDWRKLPFTCSHLGGQRPFWLLLVIGMGFLSYLGTAGLAVYQASRGWVPFAAVLPLVGGLWWKLHSRRLEGSEDTPTIFDEQERPAVESLGIRFEAGSETEPSADSFEPAARPASPFWNTLREREVSTEVEALPEDDRAVSPFFRLHGLWDDARYGLRLMRKQPALSAAVTVTLALGIGVNVAVLTLINGIAFRARVDQPETFAQVAFPYSGQGIGVGRVSPQEYQEYRERTRSITSLAAVTTMRVMLGQDRSQDAGALLVSCNFFEVYHLRQAKMGRLFTPQECATPGGAAVAVLSEGAWHDRFGSDPQILGRIVTIDDQAFTVIGVAPAHHPARINNSAVWIPYTAQPLLDPAHDIFRTQSAVLMIGGRLAAGISRRAAQAEWDVLVQKPGHKTSVSITDGSAISMVSSGANHFYVLFALLMGAPWAVLLITCANVTTMLLSRAVARRREIAVRLSLGAPRMRLLRLLLMESCLLAAVAGSVALYIAYRVPGPLFRFLTDDLPDFPLTPDWRIFAFVSGVVALTGGLAGLAPALESLKVNLTAALKGYVASHMLPARVPLRSLLVSAQVALGLTLLVCAGLLGSIDRRWQSDASGLDADRTVVVPLHFPARSSAESSLALYRNLEARITALPAVLRMAYAGTPPFMDTPVRVERPAQGEDAAVSVTAASPGYLAALGIPVVQGRNFSEADGPSGSALKAIVSQSFARTFLPNRFPVGEHFTSGPSVAFDIVGVARDIDSGAEDRLAAYVLAPWNQRNTNLVIHVAGDPAAAIMAIREAVRTAYPDILVTPRTLRSLFDERDQMGHRLATLLILLALVAVVLAVAGIYGVVSFSVSQRTRELGIRVALGARAGDILREVLISGLKPVLYGLFAGVWMALIVETAVRQTFSDQAFRFHSASPMVYGAAALLLGGAAVAAMLIPAHRGAKADPLEALHYE